MVKVGVVGLWHLGCVTSTCLANLGYKVVGYDKDKEIIKNLICGKAPILEPGLDESIKRNTNNLRLQFTTNMEEAVTGADYVLLTIDTPVDEQDRVDLTSVYDAINEISRFITNKVLIIVQSQVPVGTCDDFLKILKQKRPNVEFGLAYCPENLRLGKAIETFEKPDRIIIGSNNKQTANKVKSFFNVIDCPKIIMSLKAAEMTKHSVNAFLATCISFANWIGNLCEEMGVDTKKVIEGLMSERRIGNNLPLRAGLGFSGGTLGRDLRILEKLGKDYGKKSDLIESVLDINHEQNILVVKKILKIFNTLDGLTIGVLGLTYKAGTNTLRRSTSLEIIKELLKLNSKVNAYDPCITSVNSILNKNFQLCNSPYLAVEEASILLILTDWPEFQELDYNRIFAIMKKPIILDAKNFLNADELKSIGFDYKRLN